MFVSQAPLQPCKPPLGPPAALPDPPFPQGPQAAPIYLRAAWGPKPCLPPAEQARLVQVQGGSRLLGGYSLETFRG